MTMKRGVGIKSGTFSGKFGVKSIKILYTYEMVLKFGVLFQHQQIVAKLLTRRFCDFLVIVLRNSYHY